MEIHSYSVTRHFSVLLSARVFLKMGGKVTAVTLKVFWIGDYESEVSISKFNTSDPIWRSRIQYLS